MERHVGHEDVGCLAFRQLLLLVLLQSFNHPINPLGSASAILDFARLAVDIDENQSTILRGLLERLV